ncbi:hypothetical protein QZH41_010323, partial [Actinostola sp. cb2023]
SRVRSIYYLSIVFSVQGTGGARRCNLTTHDVTRLYDDVNTVYEAFLHGMKVSDDGACLGRRNGNGPYQWITYSQVHERAANFASGLLELGCVPSQNTYVGIWSKNCVEWFLTDIGCQMFSMVTVPIYDSHGPDACIYIIQKAGLEVILCSSSKVNFLLEKTKECEKLKTIVVIGGPVDGCTVTEAEELGIRIETFEDTEERGRINPHHIVPPRSNDAHTISWTSGTTGYPKGVLVTHDNIISDMSAYMFLINQVINYTVYNTLLGGGGKGISMDCQSPVRTFISRTYHPEHMYERCTQVCQDVHLSYLPPEHMYEHCTQVCQYVHLSYLPPEHMYERCTQVCQYVDLSYLPPEHMYERCTQVCQYVHLSYLPPEYMYERCTQVCQYVHLSYLPPEHMYERCTQVCQYVHLSYLPPEHMYERCTQVCQYVHLSYLPPEHMYKRCTQVCQYVHLSYLPPEHMYERCTQVCQYVHLSYLPPEHMYERCTQVCQYVHLSYLQPEHMYERCTQVCQYVHLSYLPPEHMYKRCTQVCQYVHLSYLPPEHMYERCTQVWQYVHLSYLPPEHMYERYTQVCQYVHLSYLPPEHMYERCTQVCQYVHLSYLPPEHMYERCTQVCQYVHLSYLPPEHMYERYTQVCVFLKDSSDADKRRSNGIFTREKRTADGRLSTTQADSVCRGATTSKRHSRQGTDNCCAALAILWYFNKCVSFLRKIIRKNTIWDRLVFKKIQNLLGGNVRIISSGSAPLSAKVTTFIRCVMGCYLQEGYGQTETTAIVTMQRLNDFTTGHVGAPAPCNQVKLVDVDEMGYYAKNGQGEICVKGRNVFGGYFGTTAENAACFDEDGWFHSGDIGQWNENGTLRIVDRKKTHLQTFPRRIHCTRENPSSLPSKSIRFASVHTRDQFKGAVNEDLYACTRVRPVFNRSCIVGIVVPDSELLLPWAKANGIQGDLKQLCQNQTVRDMIHSDMLVKGKEARLNSLEQASIEQETIVLLTGWY